MIDPDQLIDSIKAILGSSILMYIGISINKGVDKVHERLGSTAKRYLNRWEQIYLPHLAKNIARNGCSVDDYVGSDLDKVPSAFNPKEEILTNSLNCLPEERDRLKNRLDKLVSQYKNGLNR